MLENQFEGRLGTVYAVLVYGTVSGVFKDLLLHKSH